MEIKISKGKPACDQCGATFTHNAEVASWIVIEGDTWVRRDFCSACAQTLPKKEAYCIWVARFLDPKHQDQQETQSSPLRDIFYKAVEGGTRLENAVAFLAAQILKRQKQFRLLKEVEGDEEHVRVFFYLDRASEKLITVEDPKLTFQELDQARQLLLQRLAEAEGKRVEVSTS